VDRAVQDYVDAVPARTRPLFQRHNRLVLEVAPGADLFQYYKMPT
jgi:hypothetical protein